MDYLPNLETLSTWLLHYGSFVLFVLLALGIIALPVPEETLMVLSGILMSQGHLYIVPTVIAAFGGSIAGISVSYLLGRTAGHYLVMKYGGWVGIKEQHLEKVHHWFERFGKWTLFIGYFIPGVRHLTGFSAGTTNLKYPIFALYAYSGAITWVSTFLSIGYFFGEEWLSLFEHVEIRGIDDYLVIAIIVLVCIVAYISSRKSQQSRD